MIKKGDKVTVEDCSYSFGVNHNGQYKSVPEETILQVVETNLKVADLYGRKLYFDPHEDYCIVCDTLVTDGRGGFWFTQARFLENVEPEIEITIKVNGKEVSLKSLSEETLLNIRSKS